VASEIRAYFFDLGNVIVDIHPDRFFSALEIESGAERERIVEVYRTSGLSRELETGRMTFDEFYRASCDVLGVPIDRGRFTDAWNSIIGDEKPGIREVVASCAAKAPVYLLSNTNEPHYRCSLEKAPSLGYMREHFLSYALHAMKPDRHIYEAAIRRSGASAEEIFFTDDLEVNIRSAANLGLRAVRFTGVGELKAGLAAIG
jgi:glucose-1-phosphatase